MFYKLVYWNLSLSLSLGTHTHILIQSPHPISSNLRTYKGVSIQSFNPFQNINLITPCTEKFYYIFIVYYNKYIIIITFYINFISLITYRQKIIANDKVLRLWNKLWKIIKIVKQIRIIFDLLFIHFTMYQNNIITKL